MKESTWTAPNENTQHPEWWNAADSDATEYEVIELVAGFVRALQPEIVVETGTHIGVCAHAIGVALQRNGHGRLYSLEVDEARWEKARRLVEGLPVTCLLQSSLDFVVPGPIDFAWFDSLIPLRVEEFLAYRPHMHRNTVVGFHDTGPQHVLRPQLDALVGELQIIDLPTPRGVVFGRVRAQ